MKLTLLGTGNSAMMPVYGCDCDACTAAKLDPTLRREKSSAFIEKNGRYLLIDANAPDLCERFPAGTIDHILLTHYHMDHVHSLFDLRWGVGDKIPVISPDDKQGCDDLFKHPGLLDFSTKAKPFESFIWQGIKITPLPLKHSRLCLGYCFEDDFERKPEFKKDKANQRIAYLTDTKGLPKNTEQWLIENPVDWIITDCNYPPKALTPTESTAPTQPTPTKDTQNHNDFDDILVIDQACQPKNIGLIHLSHEMINWANKNPQAFSPRLRLLFDGEAICVGGTR